MNRSRTDPASMLLHAALEQAVDSLAVRGKVDMRVHGARKALKRARAALRLLRPSLGSRVFKREDRALRDAGRKLSSVREAKSLIDAIELFKRSRELVRASGPALSTLSSELERHLEQARRTFADAATRRACTAMVKSARERLRHAAPASADAAALSVGLRHIYRSGRKALVRASKRRTVDALHGWRKHVKYLQASAAALHGRRNPSLRSVGEQCGDIAAWLGDDHDLANLRDVIIRAGMSRSDTAAVLAGIDAQRQQLQSDALACGARLFQEKPRAFIASATGKAQRAERSRQGRTKPRRISAGAKS